MSSLRPHLRPASLIALSVSLAACAGTPINTAIRPMPAALRSTSSTIDREQPAPATAPAAGRVEILPAEARLYSNFEEMLNGRVAGLEVIRRNDGTLSLRVRGARGFAGEAEPLVVVDGMTYGTSSASEVLSTLSPHDVRRVDVLKDAGATAMYGSRGSNGVVLIITRRTP